MRSALRHWYTILKPGGKLYLSVPDFPTLCWLYLTPANSMNGRFRILQMMLGSQEDSHHVSHSGFDMQFLGLCLVLCAVASLSGGVGVCLVCAAASLCAGASLSWRPRLTIRRTCHGPRMPVASQRVFEQVLIHVNELCRIPPERGRICRVRASARVQPVSR